MKKLLLALMVMATLASCGKDNKVDSGSAATNGFNGTITNPLVTNSSQAQALVSMIASPSTFGQGVLTSGSNQNCGSKFYGLLTWCTSSYSGSSSSGTWYQLVTANPSLVYRYSNGTTVRHSDVNVATKQNELMSLLNSASSIQISGYQAYVTVGSTYYVIDVRYPIQANPSAAASSSGQGFYFVDAI